MTVYIKQESLFFISFLFDMLLGTYPELLRQYHVMSQVMTTPYSVQKPSKCIATIGTHTYKLYISDYHSI